MGNLQDLIKRKCDRIQNANIEATVEKVGIYTVIDIRVNDTIEPQMRHRDRKGKGKYDPLSEYKKIFKDKVFELIDVEPTSKPISMGIIYCVQPTGFNQVNRLRALAGEIVPTKKPDIDNVMKLVQDTFNGYIYEDDAQICSCFCKKEYSEQPMTIIRFTILDSMNEELEKGLRLNKEMKERYERLIQQRKIGW